MTVLKNVTVLSGTDLKLAESSNIQIRGKKFGAIGKRRIDDGDQLDCEGLMAIPGLVNMHTHVGDSIAKDIMSSGSVDAAIHPIYGAKPLILKRSKTDHLASFMETTCRTMLAGGTTTFVDFREGGAAGVDLLRQAASRVPVRAIILGRVEYYLKPSQIRNNTPLTDQYRQELLQVLDVSDGLGISGANENSDAVLRQYAQTRKIRAIHAAETRQSVAASVRITGRREVCRALKAAPHFLVHMTFAKGAELRAAARLSGVVVCPRANAALAEGTPDVSLMMRSGCTVGIGTDNVMINSPDMFREMDYLWKATQASQKKRIGPRQILKMATVNAGIILRQKIGAISKGYAADCILLNKHAIELEPMHDPYASIVGRASQSAIRAVISGGEIVHGRI